MLFENIINYLKTNEIDYILMANKDMLHAYKYPYDLRISYSETNRYRISWCIWSKIKSPDIKINHVATEDEALKEENELLKAELENEKLKVEQHDFERLRYRDMAQNYQLRIRAAKKKGLDV